MNKILSIYLFTIISSLFSITINGQNKEAQGLVTINESTLITKLITQKIDYNKQHPQNIGFTIQVYYGDENTAYSLQTKFQKLYPNKITDIKYSMPDWKVLTGKFRTRLEASRSLIEIKKNFTGAIIVKTLITFSRL